MIEGKILFLSREDMAKHRHLKKRYEAYWIFIQEEDGTVTKCKDRWDDGVTNLTKLEIAIPV